jgi:ATP-dependent Clp protease adaptor protein ClpS
MSDQEKSSEVPSEPSGGGGTAVAKPKHKTRKKPAPSQTPPQALPKWKVLLHNDDKNDIVFVVNTLIELTPLNQHDAKNRTLEAHKSGVALILVTHKERAELYKDQFQTKGLTVTIEPEN